MRVNSTGNEPISLPLLDGVAAADIPVLDGKTLLDRFPGRRFHHPHLSVVHDRDFEVFQNLQPEAVFCDIGANIGHSVNSLRLLGSKAALHSFEILPALWPFLEEHGARYGGSFQLHRYGLGPQEGTIDLFVPVIGDSALSTLSAGSFDDLKSANIRKNYEIVAPGEPVHVARIRVEVKPFDSLGLQPDFVKIDVEGAELGVLRGMTRTLTQRRPMLLIENTKPMEVEDYLAPFGYLPCGWDKENAVVRVGRGGQNSVYLHATDLLTRSRKDKRLLQSKQAIRDTAFNAYAYELGDPTSEADIVAAFRTFFGSDPTPEQVSMHSRHASRLKLRNAFLQFLMSK